MKIQKAIPCRRFAKVSFKKQPVFGRGGYFLWLKKIITIRLIIATISMQNWKSSEYVTMLSPSFQPEGTIALVIRANRLPHYALILLSVCIYFTIFRSKSNQMFDIFSRKKIASSTVQSLGCYFFNMFNLITVWGHADIPYKIISACWVSRH